MKKAQLLEEELSHEELFTEHYSWLIHWALQLTEGNRNEAEDLVHDLFIQLVRLRPHIHSNPDQARAYLYTMLRNMHLSKLRRAQQSPLCELTVIDYDSFELAQRSVPEGSMAGVSTKLWRICEYMYERKKNSRSASVLILRFFLGYFPSEIARILKTTRMPVDKYLHSARREARLFVSESAAISISGKKRTRRDVPPLPEESYELFLALRSQIFVSCEGKCFSLAALERAYAPASSKSPNTAELAHLVSCRDCLDMLNRILGIPLLADRCPSNSINRDSGTPRDGGSGTGGGGSWQEMERAAARRLAEENEHRPQYLQVAANGDIMASQKVTSEFSEFHIELAKARNIEFIEIFSEQNIRLLYLPIGHSHNSSDPEEQAGVQLSDGRTLEVSVSLSAAGISICVRYHDPLLAEPEAMDEADPLTPVAADAGFGRRMNPSMGVRKLFAWASNFCDSMWRVGAMATVLASVLVAAWLLLQHPMHPSGQPADLLEKARQRATAEILPHSLVRRTIHVQELEAMGKTIHEDAVVEWESADKQSRAKRLYNPQGTLIAEEITRGSDTKFYGKVGQAGISRLNPAHLLAQDLWQITPSAAQFQTLIVPAAPSVIQQEGDHYTICYRHPDGGDGSGLVEATLVLRREDLHALEEYLILREDKQLHHFRLVEASYDRYTPSQIHQNVFSPDEELSDNSSSVSAPTGSPDSLAMPRVSPELIVHALFLLSRVGADMNGEISVQSAAGGTLNITGSVATRDRRDEILRALEPLRGNPGVVISLLTPDQLQTSGQGRQSRQAVQVIQPAEGAIPLDRQVRQLLTEQGTSPQGMDKAMEHFSQQVLANADEAQQHAWALDLIAKRLTPAELASLPPEARMEWTQMVDMHSSALLRRIVALRSELAHLATSRQEPIAAAQPISSAEGLARAADQILQLSRSCNHDLASAFTLSAAPMPDQPLNGPGFWRSLELLESLVRQTAAADRTLRKTGAGTLSKTPPLSGNGSS